MLGTISLGAAEATGVFPEPKGHGATISKAGDQYVCVVRDPAGEVLVKYDDNLLDAINRACELAGEGKPGKQVLIDILTKGSSGSKQREKGRRHGIVPRSYQTLDFHHHEYEVVAGAKTSKFMYGFCFGRDSKINKREPDVKDPRSHVTIRNFRLSGNPKAAFDIYYCDHITIENLDLDMDPDDGKGINFRKGTFLDLRGDIYIQGGQSHGIDIVGSRDVTIGDVTVTHTKEGCGVLLSTSHTVKIGNVFGYKNEPHGSYATLRFANANVNTEVRGVYSRNSGKGIMVSSGEAGWQYRPPGSGWTTPGNHNNSVYQADILRTSGPNVFMNAPSSHNEVKYAALRETLKVTKGSRTLTMIKGPKNRVGENVLPPVVIDSSRMKTVRINELQFGFNDCSPFEFSEFDGTDKYVRDRSCDGYGYAKPTEAKGSEISWTINGGRGRHRLEWRHASKQDLSAKLYINGVAFPNVSFKGTESGWQTTVIELDDIGKGRKLIKLVAITPQGLPLIDYLEVTGPGVQASLFDQRSATQ